MYLILDKDNNIIHVNNAPTKQKLMGKQVYHKYDAKIHTIAKYDRRELPEFWKVKDGVIVEKTLKEKITAGDIGLAEGTIYDEAEDKIRAMTDAERVTGGLVTQSELDEKAAEAEREILIQEKIRTMAISELIAEGKIEE